MAIIVHDLNNTFPSKSGFHEQYIRELLYKADIQVNGSRPWDMYINHKSVYKQLFQRGSLGLGETYMEGLWDCQKPDEMLFRILRADLQSLVQKDPLSILYGIKSKIINLQTQTGAYVVARNHYDISNELYSAMLDSRMIYSCAYWKNAKDLDSAQENKLDLICRKLKLEPGQSLLDIGCGWGGLAQFAAERYDVNVVGITIAKQQALLAKAKCEGLPVEIRLEDYRNLNGKFDKIVSVGMFEHVGYKNYAEFMQIVRRTLKHDGLFLLHTIGGNQSVTRIDPWINKYIFPNAMIPSLTQIGKATEKVLITEDVQNLGPHYDPTLMAWLQRFQQAWPMLKGKGIYNEDFYRMWVYYLSCCAATFRAKENNVWQMVMSLPASLKTYESIRE